jgi:hypothetical protein
MIKGLMGSTGVVVDAGNTSLPYVSQNSSDSFSGVMRISGSDIQYYSNGVWTTLPTSYATVRLDPTTEGLLSWVRLKQTEEASRDQARRNLEAKAASHPALTKAYEAIKRAEAKMHEEVTKAQENFTLLEKIIGEEQDNVGAEMQMPMSSP